MRLWKSSNLFRYFPYKRLRHLSMYGVEASESDGNNQLRATKPPKTMSGKARAMKGVGEYVVIEALL